MSRSFHTTRKDVIQAYEEALDGDNTRVQEYRKLLDQYHAKRRTKSYVKEERQLNEALDVPLTIDRLPIEIAEKSEYLHYPVSEKDIRGLLKYMPQGLIDGLDKITLTLGKFEQRSPEESFYAEPEKDPYLGRLGHEVFGGIYRGSCLGTYFLNKNEIKLYGYVYNSGIENRHLWEFYLRLHMLQTFVHELAHHYDFANRISRGRWRMDDVTKCEIYAETMAHEWTRNYVIPYLKENYKDHYNQLNDWMKQKAKIVIDLPLLLGDCRATTKKGTIRISTLYKTSSAFEEFVQDVLSGKSQLKTCVGLAEELHYSEQYDISLKILDAVLLEDPKNIDAIGLYGDIYEHIGKYDEAIDYAKEALRLDYRDIRSHHVMCDSYAGLKEWNSVLKWACSGLHAAENKWEYYLFLQNKAEAEVELQERESARETILEVKELFGKRPIPKRIQNWETRLEKKMKEI